MSGLVFSSPHNLSVVATYDPSGLNRFHNALQALTDERLRQAEVRAVNHTGMKGYTLIKRALVKQTGIQYGMVERAVVRKLAFAGASSVAFTIIGSGRELPMRYFKPRETRKGVSAAPWNKRQVFEHTFMRGGQFPKRVAAPKLRGNVMSRIGAGRLPIEVKYGPSVGKEIVKDESFAAFEATAAQLPARLSHEIGRLLP